MADGLIIPGVSDRYKTNDIVEALMNVERVPLEREKSNLEKYEKQQSAWRVLNQKMSTLRDSVKALYSFENPFNNKLGSSTDEFSITLDAGREADYGSFKIDVLQPAETDRFLSDEIKSDSQVPEGKYTFVIGDKKIEFNWKGGKLNDFVNSMNKRGNDTIRASLIGINDGQKSLLVESLKTGEKNRLEFENKALEYFKTIGMIRPTVPKNKEITIKQNDLVSPETPDEFKKDGIPVISKSSVTINGEKITVGARGGFSIDIPAEALEDINSNIEFHFTETEIEDITSSQSSKKDVQAFSLPEPDSITYEGITVFNNPSETSLPPDNVKKENPKPFVADSGDFFYIKDKDGKETKISPDYFSRDDSAGDIKVSIPVKDFPNAEKLIVMNPNTGKQISLTMPTSADMSSSMGFEPQHAISTAKDAVIKYEGITLTRPTNDIDDVVPHVTLHVHDKTEKTATLKIEPDKEGAKNAIITFVGKYNQAIAELNILSTNKPEIISELDYLSKDEQDEAKERLGMFQGDFSLSNGKSSIQRIVSADYKLIDKSEVTMLSQAGISTNASGGTKGYNASQMRGYLEVDEKKLDSVIDNHIDDLRILFGHDTDGDLIIDNGIGLKLDKQLTAWVQSGGIISNKTSVIDGQIKNTNTKITKLESQLDKKESELKRKYASMEGSLNNLESQSDSINNFAKQNSNSRK